MLRYLLQLIVWTIFMAALLFWPAGTFAYPGAWVMLVLFAGGGLAMVLWLSKRSPELLRERMGSPIQRGQAGWDKIFLGVFMVLFFGWLGFMSWDAARTGFSAVPVWLQVFGALLIVLEFAGCAWTFNANTFAAPVVKIQEGQKVIDTGPYALVRHPMYTSALLLFIGLPLLLGSWRGLWISALLSLALAWRSVGEEETLRHHFTDYDTYRRRVKYRLVPGVW